MENSENTEKEITGAAEEKTADVPEVKKPKAKLPKEVVKVEVQTSGKGKKKKSAGVSMKASKDSAKLKKHKRLEEMKALEKSKKAEDRAKLQKLKAQEEAERAKEEAKRIKEEKLAAKRLKKEEWRKAHPKKKLKDLFCKQNWLIIILLSLSASFTVFFFSPMDIFIGNQREFIVEFKCAALPMLALSGIAFVLLAELLILLLLIWEWLFRIVSRLLTGCLLAVYVQTLFLNSNMSTITGDDVKYKDTKMVTLNLIIVFTIAAAPLILHILATIFKKNKVLNFGKGMVVPYVAGLIFVMQLVGTGSNILTTDFSQYKRTYNKYLAYEPAMNLSKDGNIVVFLADRLDSYYMDEVLERYPEVADKLEGFTFYQNNISHNTNTFPSIPQMLTNTTYHGEDWVTYNNESWAGNTLPKVLTENGWDVNLLIDNLTTYSNLEQIAGQCANISTCSSDVVEVNYVKKNGIVPTMTRLSLSKLLPYKWKAQIISGLGSSLSQGFIKYHGEMPDIMPQSVDAESDLRFRSYLKNFGLNADNSDKTFSFIHLNCSHGSNKDIAALYSPDEPVNLYSTTRGAFEIMFEYMEQMKKLGIYDNSTIIILGDHGRPPVEIEIDDLDVLTKPIVTGLLVKPATAKRDPLMLDKSTELSNDFFAASVLEFAGIDHEDFGLSYYDVTFDNPHPDRYLQTYDWHGYGNVVPKTLYKVTGDAREWENWEAQEGHE